MSDAAAAAVLSQEEIVLLIEDLNGKIKAQGNKVRTMKKEKTPKEELSAAVAELQALKAQLVDARSKDNAESDFDRDSFEAVMKGRFFYAPAFELYSGVAGLYDYGPCGCAIKTNLLNLWREHFVLEESMLEVDCTAMTPHCVLETSGHVERFTDIMVKIVENGECVRADHLLEDLVDELLAKNPDSAEETRLQKIRAQADVYSPAEIDALFKGEFKAQVQERFAPQDKKKKKGKAAAAPAADAPYPLTDAGHFNMMFPTSIGPTGNQPAFLRPETAQGIFLCFKRLYEFNGSRLPFAGAQIGLAFRNEISPRNGLLRVREFQMAEIEHFVDPEDKSHPKFKYIKDLEIPVLSACDQVEGKTRPTLISLDKAVNGENPIISSETLGYFLGRIHRFMTIIGVDPQRIRFRQHMSGEMAHYAKDCWDCELHTSYGWVECVGCADRSCYDLERHAEVTKTPLQASVTLAEPQQLQVWQVVLNKKKVGSEMKGDASHVFGYYAALAEDDIKALQTELAAMADGASHKIETSGGVFEVPKEWITIECKDQTIYERKFTPSVIEPSFGIGRIIYCLLEQSFVVRAPEKKSKEEEEEEAARAAASAAAADDKKKKKKKDKKGKAADDDSKRAYLSLPPIIAPVKCSILPLRNDSAYDGIIATLSKELGALRVSYRIDNVASATIGRRYARTDEIAIPFAITLDPTTISEQMATLRERNTMQQIRVPLAEASGLISDMCQGTSAWADAVAKYGIVDTRATSE